MILKQQRSISKLDVVEICIQKFAVVSCMNIFVKFFIYVQNSFF